MEKDNIKKLMSTIGAILVLLCTSGCSKKVETALLFSDSIIAEECSTDDLKAVTNAYKDVFFSHLPILNRVDYNKEYIDYVFNHDYLNLDFDEAYIFLQSYLNLLNKTYDGLDNCDNIGFDNQKDDEFSNNATLEFTNDHNTYRLNVYNREYILDSYERVVESCETPIVNFIKDYTYTYNQIPGDKNYKKNKANYTLSYGLLIKSGLRPYQIYVTSDSIVNNKSNIIKTESNEKRIFVYSQGRVVLEKRLSNKEFNEYVNDIYNIYLNESRYIAYKNSNEAKSNKILKLIKKDVY